MSIKLAKEADNLRSRVFQELLFKWAADSSCPVPYRVNITHLALCALYSSTRTAVTREIVSSYERST